MMFIVSHRRKHSTTHLFTNPFPRDSQLPAATQPTAGPIRPQPPVACATACLPPELSYPLSAPTIKLGVMYAVTRDALMLGGVQKQLI